MTSSILLISIRAPPRTMPAVRLSLIAQCTNSRSPCSRASLTRRTLRLLVPRVPSIRVWNVSGISDAGVLVDVDVLVVLSGSSGSMLVPMTSKTTETTHTPTDAARLGIPARPGKTSPTTAHRNSTNDAVITTSAKSHFPFRDPLRYQSLVQTIRRVQRGGTLMLRSVRRLRGPKLGS